MSTNVIWQKIACAAIFLQWVFACENWSKIDQFFLGCLNISQLFPKCQRLFRLWERFLICLYNRDLKSHLLLYRQFQKYFRDLPKKLLDFFWEKTKSWWFVRSFAVSESICWRVKWILDDYDAFAKSVRWSYGRRMLNFWYGSKCFRRSIAKRIQNSKLLETLFHLIS